MYTLHRVRLHVSPEPRDAKTAPAGITQSTPDAFTLAKFAPLQFQVLWPVTGLDSSAWPTLIMHRSQARSFKPSHIAAAIKTLYWLKGTLHPGIKPSVKCTVTQNTRVVIKEQCSWFSRYRNKGGVVLSWEAEHLLYLGLTDVGARCQRSCTLLFPLLLLVGVL